MIGAVVPKPPCGARVAFGHPLAHRLEGFWPFNERGGTIGFDAVRPQTRAGFADFGMLRTEGAFFHGSAFPGTSWATIPYLAALRPTAAVTFWIRVRTVQTSFPSGFSQPIRGASNDDGSSYGFATSYIAASAKWTVNVNAGGVDRTVTAPSVIATGVWHDLVGTYDGAALRMYIDAALVGSQACSGAMSYNASPSPTILGAIAGSSGSLYFEGSMEFAAIWSRALSGGDVIAFARDPYATLRAPRVPAAARLASPYFYQRHVLGHGGGGA